MENLFDDLKESCTVMGWDDLKTLITVCQMTTDFTILEESKALVISSMNDMSIKLFLKDLYSFKVEDYRIYITWFSFELYYLVFERKIIIKQKEEA